MQAWPANVRLFVAFRVLFNARFYYPVFAVLFLDFGLSIEQFTLLNVAWAVSIVLLEVPSGALADRIGRKIMVQIAAFLMVIEMLLIVFSPVGSPEIVFWILLVNRLLSGAAEAAASGADEALAYDSMVDAGRGNDWPHVLEVMMRWQSGAFLVAMLLGAAVYDPDFLNAACGACGFDVNLSKMETLRLPVILTLITACFCLASTLRLQEPQRHRDTGLASSVGDSFKLVGEAGRWILRHRFVFSVILVAVIHDSIGRMFVTLGSEYYRIIRLPEVLFGVMGAALAGLGLVLPIIARKMVGRFSAGVNFGVCSLISLAGLGGAALAIPYWGVIFVALVMSSFSFLNFFLSHYINANVESSRRATVLSFKGLAMNIGYGGMGLIYAGILTTRELEKEELFAASLKWFPGLLILGVVVILFMRRWPLRSPR